LRVFPLSSSTLKRSIPQHQSVGHPRTIIMAGTKKINKAKARPTVIATYEVLAGMDGNPNTPKEFDEDPHTDGEVFFKADDDATKVRACSFSSPLSSLYCVLAAFYFLQAY
jgi:hypothetical protein